MPTFRLVNDQTFNIGWLAAFVTLILTIMLWVMGVLPKEWALLTIAVCCNRI